MLSVNSPSRVHHVAAGRVHRTDSNNRYDLLYYEGNGRFVLYDPGKHGLWEVFERQDGTRGVRRVSEPNWPGAAEPEIDGDQCDEVEVTSPTRVESSRLEHAPLNSTAVEFRREIELRDYLAQKLDQVRGLGTSIRLYQENGVPGIEFQTDVGRVDILAIGENGAFYVLELKLARGADAAVGQTLRYMAAIRATVAKGRPVYGVIVAAAFSKELRRAVSEVGDRVFLLRYELQLLLERVEAVRADDVVAPGRTGEIERGNAT